MASFSYPPVVHLVSVFHVVPVVHPVAISSKLFHATGIKGVTMYSLLSSSHSYMLCTALLPPGLASRWRTPYILLALRWRTPYTLCAHIPVVHVLLAAVFCDVQYVRYVCLVELLALN